MWICADITSLLSMINLVMSVSSCSTLSLFNVAQVVNSHLVCDPTIRQPGFDLPRQQWSLMNRFRTEQGHCGACRRKWRLTDTDLCPCGETQTMSHIVKSCPLTKLNGSLSQLHSADEDAVSWLTSYGSWHAYEKKKKTVSWLSVSIVQRWGWLDGCLEWTWRVSCLISIELRLQTCHQFVETSHGRQEWVHER